MGDDPSSNLPIGRDAEYDPVDLAALAAKARSQAAVTRDIGALANEAFRGAHKVGRDKKNLLVSRGFYKVEQGGKHFSLTLLRDRRTPDWIYVVEASQPYPEQALFTITQMGIATPPGWMGGKTLDPQKVLEIVEGVRVSALAAKRKRSLRRLVPRLSRSTAAKLGNSALGLAGAAMVVYLVIGLVSSVPEHTSAAIIDGQVVPSDGKEHKVPWSEQYDVLSIKKLTDDKNARIPAIGPRQIKPPSKTWGGCKVVTRDVREGDTFRAIYRGERGDEFTITIDSKSNKIKVCRDDVEHGKTDDTVIIQRIEE